MDPEALNSVGHVCYGLIFAGHLLIARRATLGWPVRAIGTVGWVVLGLLMGMSAIWVWCLLFTCLDIYGWKSWSTDRQPDSDSTIRRAQQTRSS